MSMTCNSYSSDKCSSQNFFRFEMAFRDRGVEPVTYRCKMYTARRPDLRLRASSNLSVALSSFPLPSPSPFDLLLLVLAINTPNVAGYRALPTHVRCLKDRQ